MTHVFISVSKHNAIYSETILNKITEVSVLEFLIGKLISDNLFKIHVLTSTKEYDDIIDEISKKYGILATRSDYYNKMSCVMECMQNESESYFVLIDANYPLIDVEKIHEIVNEHIVGHFDYSCNDYQDGVIWGTGCNVFDISFLKNLDCVSVNEYDINEISYYIFQNKDKYKVNCKIGTVDTKRFKLACENMLDINKIKKILKESECINKKSLVKYMTDLEKEYVNSTTKEFNENGVEKLMLHVEKTDSLISSNEIDRCYPISVELTLTNICNLKCVYCSDYDLRKRQGVSESLDIGTLKNLFDDLSRGGTKGVVLEGGGEPTLHKDFNKIVKYAKKAGLALGLITNGTQRLSEDILKEFEWIRVSLDASTRVEYMSLKGIDYFQNVIHNIAYFAQYCKTIGVGYVVTKQNYLEIEPLIRLIRRLGVSYIQLRPVVDCPELFPKDVNLLYLKKYQTSTFTINIEGMYENSTNGNNHLPCRANGLTSVISGDGSVYLCGRLNIYDWVKPIGNINYQKFNDIWNSVERKQQWEMVQNADFCENVCPQCRMSKFNKYIIQINNLSTKNFI